MEKSRAIDLLDNLIGMVEDNQENDYDTALRMGIDALKAQLSQEFIKLTVRYSNGRPYYSIIYLEYDKNGVGHDFEGYSSYSLDVISEYLKKYFMPPAQPEPTDEQVEEYCKKRCLHVVTDDFFESTKPQRLGHWIPYDNRFPWKNDYKCSECGNYLDFSGVNGGRVEPHYCPNCGAKMTISTK